MFCVGAAFSLRSRVLCAPPPQGPTAAEWTLQVIGVTVTLYFATRFALYEARPSCDAAERALRFPLRFPDGSMRRR